MSEENVEVHRRSVDTFNARDIDAWLEIADPEVEFTPFNLEVEGGDPYRGHDGIRRFWETYFTAFSDVRVEADEIRDLGEVTVALVHIRGRGTESGASFDQAIWQVCKWRDEKCVWWGSFRSEAAALEAAGLSE